MTRAEAVAVVLVILAAIFTLVTTVAAAWLNRRIMASADLSSRVTALETKVNLLDVGGTHANRALIVAVRQDLEALEALHRHDLDEVDNRVGSLGLSIATLSERLNAAKYGDQRRANPPRD